MPDGLALAHLDDVLDRPADALTARARLPNRERGTGRDREQSLHAADELDREALQVRLEARMASIGAAAFRSRAAQAREKHRATDLPAGLAMLRRAIGPMIEGIEELLRTAVDEGKPGWLNSVVPRLRVLGADAVALVTAQIVLNHAADEPTLTSLARKVGNALHGEARVVAFAKQHGGLFKAILEHQTRHRCIGSGHRAKTLLAASRRAELDFEPWTDREELEIGVKLVAMFAERTGWIEIVQARCGQKTQHMVHLSPEAQEWADRVHKHVELMSCQHLPCVLPPRDWSTPYDGGFHTPAVPPLTIVKTRRKAHLRLLEQAEMPTVYAAINALQRTPWTINTRVLEVAEALWEAGETTAGLPSREPVPIPEKPADIATNEEARKAWRKAAAVAYEERTTSLSKRLYVAKTLAYAREYAAHRRHFYVHQMDFRGRLYAVTAYLSPQAEDLTRGLLMFADGLPLADRAAVEWLMIHTANCFGVDKVPFADRLRWVLEHRGEIEASARDPLGERWWTTADKPFQFLAACCDLAGFWRDGLGHVSHLPVSMDGSNNGLQHFAALLRDQETAEAVNLTPSDQPQDIYARVAARAEAILRDQARTEPAAVPWLACGWMDRKVAKRPTMVLPYGGTFASCREYVEEAVRDREKATGARPFGIGEARRKSILVGAQAVWQALGEVVVAARVGMGFLQGVARVAAKAGVPMHWTAPSGFPVWHEYREMRREHAITTHLHGRAIQIRPRGETPRLDAEQQKQAIAPNVVHSLDAAALVGTIAEGQDVGIVAWRMIHDSFGTHAANAPRLAECLRLAFCDLYLGRDLLAELRDEIAAQLPEKARAELPAVPRPGTLDVSAVLRAPYFFA
jgi:DNA-directed RNA polymerase